MTQKLFLSYDAIRKNKTVDFLVNREMPESHAVCLPLPTMRSGKSAYAQFASPSNRRLGKPVHQGAPERWWMIDAKSGNLLFYAFYVDFPFSPQNHWPSQDLPSLGISMAQFDASFSEWIEKIEVLAPHFFTGMDADATDRAHWLSAAKTITPSPVLEQYRALAPDFFEWLEKNNHPTMPVEKSR